MGKWSFISQMTQQEKLQDLLYFKGKIDTYDIKLESIKEVEKEHNFNIILSIIK